MAERKIGEMRRRVEEEDRQYYVMKKRRNVSEERVDDEGDKIEVGEVIEHPYRGRAGAKEKKYLRVSS